MSSFLYIPSPIYAFRNSKGYIIPKLMTDEESIKTLYSLQSDDMTPIKTTYARTRTSPLAADEYRIQDSIKGGIRQYYRDDFFYIEPKFVIVCATIRYDYKSLLVDICKFPMNLSANMFLASDLAIERNPNKIRQYLHSNGIFNITQFDYYPEYYLFFLLTRFYSYPYTPIQLQLAEERNNATEFQKRAIDSIFENKDALQYLEAIMTNSLNFESKYDVSSWIEEYILNSNKEKLMLNPNEYQTVISLAEILYSWTDNEIDEYANSLNFELPTRATHDTRYSWVESISGFVIATGIYGFQEATLFPDLNSYDGIPDDYVWRDYSNFGIMLV